MTFFFPNYLDQNHLIDCCFQNNNMTLIQEDIIEICSYGESRSRLYTYLYGERLSLKHLSKNLGNQNPGPMTTRSHIFIDRI